MLVATGEIIAAVRAAIAGISWKVKRADGRRMRLVEIAELVDELRAATKWGSTVL